MTGAPINGVTELRGSIPPATGTEHITLHTKAMTAPKRIVNGRSTRWLSVFIKRREICGTASPMNETGPQKAVTTDVNTPVITNMELRNRFVLNPRFSA